MHAGSRQRRPELLTGSTLARVTAPPPDLDALDLGGTVVGPVLHTTDKSWLAEGSHGGRPVVVKILTSTVPRCRRGSRAGAAGAGRVRGMGTAGPGAGPRVRPRRPHRPLPPPRDRRRRQPGRAAPSPDGPSRAGYARARRPAAVEPDRRRRPAVRAGRLRVHRPLPARVRPGSAAHPARARPGSAGTDPLPRHRRGRVPGRQGGRARPGAADAPRARRRRAAARPAPAGRATVEGRRPRAPLGQPVPSSPASWTSNATCTRLLRSSLVRIADTCVLTVARLRWWMAAISALERPAPTSTAT